MAYIYKQLLNTMPQLSMFWSSITLNKCEYIQVKLAQYSFLSTTGILRPVGLFIFFFIVEDTVTGLLNLSIT